MPVFRYRAITSAGATIQGTFTAAVRSEVVEMLRQRNSFPVTVEEEQQRDLNFKIFSGVGVRDMAVFCRQFHSMLNAGVNILTCLDILRVQIENKKLREVAGQLYENVQKGLTFSQALSRHRDVFPNLLISMVEAGEMSGNLDAILNRMAHHYEKEYKLNNKIKSAMVYPIILMVVAVLVVTFLLTFVMPTFVGMFTTTNVELPLPTRILLAISKFLQYYWYLLFAAVGLIIYGFLQYSRSPSGRRRLDELKLRLPVIKGVARKVTASRFTRTMSTMMMSGIPLLQALENVAQVVDNTVIMEAILKIREDVRRGKTLSDPVQASGHFPPMVDNMIRIGEESGTLDDLMNKSADFFDEEVDIAVQRLTTLFEPAMIVVMGIIVGFIVISMVMPMFDMVKTVQ